MNIGRIWAIVWQDSIFHWAAASLFIVVVGLECGSVWHYWVRECGLLQSVIRYLEGDAKGLLLPQGQAWLDNYLIRRDQGFIKQNHRYVLQQYPSLLSRAIPRSSLRFVPTILTAIGVLGTFYGIQEGLQGISPTISDSQSLMAASQDLFDGMKTAFSTSLIGLGSSSLFTLVLAGSELARQSRRNQLRQRLDRVAVLENSDTAFVNAANQLAQFNPEFLGHEMGEQVGIHLSQAIANQLTPVFQDINDSLRTLHDIKADQGEKIVDNVIKSLRAEILCPIATGLQQSAVLTQQASGAVQSLQQELSGVMCSLSESVTTIQTLQRDTLGQMQAVFEQQTQTLQTVGQEASMLIDNAKVQLVESLQQVDGMLQQSSQQVDGSMKTIQETAEAVSKLALADHVSWGSRVNELEQAARGIGDELQQLEQSHRQMQETYEQMNQQMQETYHQALLHWRSELKEHLQRFSNAQAQFFADADSSMAVVSNKFLETANVLVEIERNRDGGKGGENGAN